MSTNKQKEYNMKQHDITLQLLNIELKSLNDAIDYDGTIQSHIIHVNTLINKYTNGTSFNDDDMFYFNYIIQSHIINGVE